MNDENQNYQRVAPAARKLWIIHGCIGTIVILSIVVAVYAIAYRHIWVFVLPALEAVYAIGLKPAIEYRQWRYHIGADRIEIIHGIFFTNHSLIPVNRIQHLKIQQGILQKRFDLATVDIYTAGGSHQIQALQYSEAEKIVLRLNHLVASEEFIKEMICTEGEVRNEEDA